MRVNASKTQSSRGRNSCLECWSFTPRRSSFARPVPVDPKDLSVRRSAGMVAAAPALPRLEYFIVTTFFKVQCLLSLIRRPRMGCIELTLDKRLRLGQLMPATLYGRRSSRRRRRRPSDTGNAPRGDSLGGRERGYGRRIHLISTPRSHHDAARPQVFEHDEQDFGDGLRATPLYRCSRSRPTPLAEALIRAVAAILFRPQIEEETVKCVYSPLSES